MKIVEAIWEKDNIGSDVIEFTIEKSDVLSDDEILSFPNTYDYKVVKVPVNMTHINWVLGNNGYTMIETQIKLSKKISDFNFEDRFIKRLLPFVSYRKVSSIDHLNMILQRISPQMFITDRIALDPYYGSEVGCNRYKNYISTSFNKRTAEIIGVFFKDQLVGFEMYTINERICHGILGGIFDDVRIPGIGFLVACSPLLFTSKENNTNKFVADISTNNIPVVELYEYLHFHIDEMTYVFVKHNK